MLTAAASERCKSAGEGGGIHVLCGDQRPRSRSGRFNPKLFGVEIRGVWNLSERAREEKFLGRHGIQHLLFSMTITVSLACLFPFNKTIK